jgi:hypothetical protein
LGDCSAAQSSMLCLSSGGMRTPLQIGDLALQLGNPIRI